LRSMRSHRARVSSIVSNSHLLSSGSRDGSIHHHDVRIPPHHVASLVSHTQEVCGYSWSPNGQQLASGSNDNTVYIWDRHAPSAQSLSSAVIVKPKHTLTAHTAAVKAFAWCPWKTNSVPEMYASTKSIIHHWSQMIRMFYLD